MISVSFIVWFVSPLGGATPRETWAYGFALIAGFVRFFGSLITYRFSLAGAVMLGVSTVVFSVVTIFYDLGLEGFIPCLILPLVGATFGILERRKYLESRARRSSEA
ncbi:MAG: hypothetical protein WKF81_05565 [Thermomicrobiales bacterium]